MAADADILHHVGLITRDMDATIAQYERLGFSFTPLTLPTRCRSLWPAAKLAGYTRVTAALTS